MAYSAGNARGVWGILLLDPCERRRLRPRPRTSKYISGAPNSWLDGFPSSAIPPPFERRSRSRDIPRLSSLLYSTLVLFLRIRSDMLMATTIGRPSSASGWSGTCSSRSRTIVSAYDAGRSTARKRRAMTSPANPRQRVDSRSSLHILPVPAQRPSPSTVTPARCDVLVGAGQLVNHVSSAVGFPASAILIARFSPHDSFAGLPPSGRSFR